MPVASCLAWLPGGGTRGVEPALTHMQEQTDDRASRTEPALFVLLGLVFVPVFLVHAIALLAEGG